MNKGFSLVELIVVIAIMAILVGVAVPVYTQYIGNANDSVDKQTAGEVEHAIAVLLIDNTVDNPTVASGETFTIELTDKTFKLNGATDTDGAFMKELAKIVPDVDLNTSKTVTFTVNVKTLTVTNNADSVLDSETGKD